MPRRQRRRPRRASQAPQAPLSPPWASICRPRPLSDEEYKVFQQLAPQYAGVTVVVPPEAQAALKREGELIEQYEQEHRRLIEAETARVAAEEAARREAAEREARRRRRRRAGKRRRAIKAAAEREAARVIAEQQAAAERKANVKDRPRGRTLPKRHYEPEREEERVKRKADEQAACTAKQKTPRPPQQSDVQRAAMTQDQIDGARTKLRDAFNKAYCGVDAAYSAFQDWWGEDTVRSKQKVPGRTQFLEKVWRPEAGRKS